MSEREWPGDDDDYVAAAQRRNGTACGATYGQNPDACYQPAGHDGTHSNRYGTTWADLGASGGEGR